MVAIMERETTTNNTVLLDPDQKSPRAQEFEEKLASRIVGQERAVRRMSGLYQIFLAGMNPPNRPVGTMLSKLTALSSSTLMRFLTSSEVPVCGRITRQWRSQSLCHSNSYKSL